MALKNILYVTTLLLLLSLWWAEHGPKRLLDSKPTTNEDQHRQKVENKNASNSLRAHHSASNATSLGLMDYFTQTASTVDWETVKTTIYDEKDIILYCTCIIILTSILLILFMAIKSKFYTNKYGQKDLFTAKKLFKNRYQKHDKMKNRLNQGLKPIKEDENESYDVESFKLVQPFTPIFAFLWLLAEFI